MRYTLENIEIDGYFEVVAKSYGEVAPVGVARARTENKTMRLESIYVAPETGLGSILLEAIMALAQSKGLREMTGTLATFPGEERRVREFYEKMGVKISDSGELYKSI